VAVADAGVENQDREDHIMTIHCTPASTLLAAVLLLGASSLAAPILAAESGPEQYVGEAPTAFTTPDEAVAAFKAALAADDFAGFAKLLGLDAAKLKGAEGIADRVAEIRAGAAKLVAVREDGEQRILNLGPEVWPFPFPIRKGADGKWAFDTTAGIEEIVNRRIGENELQAIATARAYVDAQRDYAADDHDGDGVQEYAQKMVSSEGLTDGLYWPIEQGDGDSPAGSFADTAAIDKAKAGNGYFGYRFRILNGQGNNIAGGRYDYVINGNMIAGFALIAWPVNYAETGVNTFAVNQAGIVYEKDLGPDTEAIVKGTFRFNPNKTWNVVSD
jgi:hypothetical protein